MTTADQKKTVALLFGGCSPEYEVSLCSAAAVLRGLDPARYDVIPVGITRRGEWFRCACSADDIEAGHWTERPLIRASLSPDRSVHGLLEWDEAGVRPVRVDVVFPMLHGANGEDGTVQGLCELAGIPYVGCGVLGSAACMDKEVAHTLAAAAGVRVPRSVTLYKGEEGSPLERAAGLLYPLFVKPANAGSSYGITRVERADELTAAVELAFAFDSKAVVEEEIPGFEVGCAVIGNRELFIGEVDEVALGERWLDYEEKYGNRTAEIRLPARISPESRDKIRDTAAVLYQALGCRGFARVDMFLTPAGDVVFNEINTIPGFTAHSRYPKMLEAAGMPFSAIAERLITRAEEPA